MSDDVQLLMEFADRGSEAAFAELVRRHLDLVHSAACRQVAGDVHRAEEVTQAVFVELARQARRLRHHRSLAGWLYTTARFMAARNQRAEQRRQRRELAAHAMNVPATGPSPDWEDIRPLLDEAMHRLPAADRHAVVLRYFQDRPLAEVGRILGVGENAARMRIARALERLRRELDRRGVPSTAVALAAVLRTQAVIPAPAGMASTVTAAAVMTPVGAGGIAMLVADGLATGMTFSRWLTLGTITVGAALVGPRLLPVPPPPPPVFEAQFANSSLAAASAPAELSDPGFRWASIESADYRQFIANLRASGAPETLIRDVVSLEVLASFVPRIRAVLPAPPQRAYWQKSVNVTPTPEQQRRLTEFDAEMKAILRGLIGDAAGSLNAHALLYSQPDVDAVRLAWLPPESATAAQAVLEPVLQQEYAESRPEETGEDMDRRLERRLSALSVVLSPEQLREYRLRNSIQLDSLRAQLRHWDPTEAEFLALAEKRDAALLRPTVRMEDLRERESRATHVLGADRARSFIRATDLSYGYIVAFARQSGLPADTADRVWEIKRATLAEDERLRLQGGLVPDSLQSQRAALRQRATADLIALVGDHGLRHLQQDWMWWQALDTP